MFYKGSIVKYMKKSNIGFIKNEEGEELFFHISNIKGLVVFPLVNNEVSYKIITINNRLEAIDIQLSSYIQANKVMISNLDLFDRSHMKMLSSDQISLIEFFENEIANKNEVVMEMIEKLSNDEIDKIMKYSSSIKKYISNKMQNKDIKDKYFGTYLNDKLNKTLLEESSAKFINIIGAGGTGKTEYLHRILNEDTFLITKSNGERNISNKFNHNVLTIAQLLLKADQIKSLEELYYNAIRLFSESNVRKSYAPEIFMKLANHLDSSEIKDLKNIYESYNRNYEIIKPQRDTVYRILSKLRFNIFFTEESDSKKLDEYSFKYGFDINDLDNIYGKMLANKELTYKSLIYLFCHDYLTLSELSNKTLLIDDINTF